MITTILVIFLAAIKFLSFLRVFEPAGDFIMLIRHCLFELKIFIVFFVFWVWIFSLCILALGGEYE